MEKEQNNANPLNQKLRQFIETIEHLEAEKKEVANQISDVYREAKNAGFDAKIVKKIIALRKMDQNKRAEEEQLLETYKEALGMVY